MIFYVLTIGGLFVLRRAPDAERPYRAFGYPVLPALYLVAALVILIVLALYRTQTSWPGLLIVLLACRFFVLAEVSGNRGITLLGGASAAR